LLGIREQRTDRSHLEINGSETPPVNPQRTRYASSRRLLQRYRRTGDVCSQTLRFNCCGWNSGLSRRRPAFPITHARSPKQTGEECLASGAASTT